ncbi:hypothetical protein B0H11DRAFT_773642, partial [Mycena galericulata]
RPPAEFEADALTKSSPFWHEFCGPESGVYLCAYVQPPNTASTLLLSRPQRNCDSKLEDSFWLWFLPKTCIHFDRIDDCIIVLLFASLLVQSYARPGRSSRRAACFLFLIHLANSDSLASGEGHRKRREIMPKVEGTTGGRNFEARGKGSFNFKSPALFLTSQTAHRTLHCGSSVETRITCSLTPRILPARFDAGSEAGTPPLSNADAASTPARNRGRRGRALPFANPRFDSRGRHSPHSLHRRTRSRTRATEVNPPWVWRVRTVRLWLRLRPAAEKTANESHEKGAPEKWSAPAHGRPA